MKIVLILLDTVIRIVIVCEIIGLIWISYFFIIGNTHSTTLNYQWRGTIGGILWTWIGSLLYCICLRKKIQYGILFIGNVCIWSIILFAKNMFSGINGLWDMTNQPAYMYISYGCILFGIVTFITMIIKFKMSFMDLWILLNSQVTK